MTAKARFVAVSLAQTRQDLRSSQAWVARGVVLILIIGGDGT